MDFFTDVDAAFAATASNNVRYASALLLSPIEEELRRSLQFKASKALQAKERLRSEEALMLAKAMRRQSGIPAPKASDIRLAEGAEPFRQALAATLAEFPYVTGARVGHLHERVAMGKNYDGTWDVLANGAELCSSNAQRLHLDLTSTRRSTGAR